MNAFPQSEAYQSKWRLILFLTAAIWLSCSLLLDLVIMPQLYVAGMMTQPGFASAGYSIFWVFNRVELVCAALIVTGAIILYRVQSPTFQSKRAIALSLLLLTIGLVFTYGLTPEMSALGLQLDWFATSSNIPSEMQQMQQGYWMLEAIKLVGVGMLLKLSQPNTQSWLVSKSS